LVTRFELKSDTLASNPNALLWVPETLVLSKSIPAGSFIEVCRDPLRYFVSPDGRSQLAGGSIADGSQFVIAAGLGSNAVGRVVDGTESSALLIAGLKRLSLTDVFEFFSRDINRSVGRLLRPLSVFGAGFLLVYLLASSLYLLASSEIRSWQLERTASEVAPLFESERQVDALTSQSAQLAELANARVESWLMWEVIPAIWKNDGFLTGVFLDGDKLLLRARAPNAVAVLESISQSPVVADARFEAGVRQNAGQEDFAILLRLKSPSVTNK